VCGIHTRIAAYPINFFLNARRPYKWTIFTSKIRSNLSNMRFLRLLTFFPFLLLGGSPAVLHARAQGSPGKILTDDIDTFINHLLADWTSPGGAAVAVVKLNDQDEWNVETKGYGIATANGTKVTENTRFAIASNSKVRI
jgi:CubicO group peptidase (beta-lactamase class C family)